MSDKPSVTALGGGRYLVSDGTRRRLAYAVAEPGRTWVFLDGRVHVVSAEPARPGRQAAHAQDETALAPPMPATVGSIKVAPGQRVTRGDVLIMLEAMKMEMPIKAPRDGVVKSIACRAGELVQPGVPLLELE